ncbi:MAG TPA: beta-ketoacyl synthase N-terminal-like domain-containing protein, partial [Candidatus Ozemobacteraceae bacterium]|nr:beta-ketoacyl synthase N-terminal-like domain-containing protein [Candidatus Ozemobacteraceae bacterium]
SKEIYYRPDSTDADELRVCTGAWIDDQTLDAGGFPGRNRLRRMTLQATTQALAGFSRVSIEARRIHVYLGCMDPDESYATWRFSRREIPRIRERLQHDCHVDESAWETAIRAYVTANHVSSEEYQAAMLTSSVLHQMREVFGVRGEVGLVDAACASSLAAIDHAIHVLHTGTADLVISGGIEANLGPESFALFSVLGALAADHCLPFDRHGTGLSLGEGAVILALERLEDALRLNHPIHGILKACGASSDGRSSSLFAPTIAGQKRAYAQAYAGLDLDDLVYLECHGTGTRIGDETELRSVNEFFRRPQLPIGSAKALIGHTKGAAGAVGVLKCLLSLQHRVIPPSRYFREPCLTSLNCMINTTPLTIHNSDKPALMGISSFGFGGINYHLVIEEYRAHGGVKPTEYPASHRVYISVDRFFPWDELAQLSHLDHLHVPPNSRPQIDRAQLGALNAVAEITRELRLDWSAIPAERIQVISASSLGLDACVDLTTRLRYAQVRTIFPQLPEAALNGILELRQRFSRITSDSSPGVLNNVLAGRVANAFDFHGPNFNVDADNNGLSLALSIASRRLMTCPGVVIILALREEISSDGAAIDRSGVHCLILSSEEHAWKCGLPLREMVEKVDYDPAVGGVGNHA